MPVSLFCIILDFEFEYILNIFAAVSCFSFPNFSILKGRLFDSLSQLQQLPIGVWC